MRARGKTGSLMDVIICYVQRLGLLVLSIFCYLQQSRAFHGLSIISGYGGRGQEQTVENPTRLFVKMIILEALKENLKVCLSYY